jgi:hypothetical protein
MIGVDMDQIDSSFQVSSFSPTAGRDQSDQIRNFSKSNVELRNSCYLLYLKTRSMATSTIRQSSIFNRHSPFHEVSYKRCLWPQAASLFEKRNFIAPHKHFSGCGSGL